MNHSKGYKVYTKKGEFHHGYNSCLEGSRKWAIDCAKIIDGFVVEVDEDGEEFRIFNNSSFKNVPVD